MKALLLLFAFAASFHIWGHGGEDHWYYKIPGVKKLIDSDIKDSKKHLDFSKDFLFMGHETLIKDLDAIGKSILNDSMSPFRYLIMHGDKKLTKDEVKQVDKWIRESKVILK